MNYQEDELRHPCIEPAIESSEALAPSFDQHMARLADVDTLLQAISKGLHPLGFYAPR